MTGLRNNPPEYHLKKYGCTKEQWIELRNIGLAMVEAGASQDATPLRAYQHQRDAAVNRRKIEWKLTLMEWWTIWQESGFWEKRGLGRGYMMCRKGDVGPYAIGNVFIGPGAENLSDAAKKADLPIGVSYVVKGVAKPYRAYCNFMGKQRHLGLFATIEEARAAYETARRLDELVTSTPSLNHTGEAA
jgi:hypothetical protein